MNICYITRPDLMPTSHGAAVKIVRTAEALSRLGATVTVVTNDRVWFYKSQNGVLIRRRYPQALLSATNLPPILKDRLAALGIPTYWHLLKGALNAIGYPEDEHFLYQPILDIDFLIRVLYVGWAHDIDIYQAEFPGYAAPAIVAAKYLGGKSILAQHNVEYDRLGATTHLKDKALSRLKDIELGLCARVDHVIACSTDDREILIADGIDAARISVIPHGVELKAYAQLTQADAKRQAKVDICKRYQLDPQIPLIIFHGTLHYWPNTIAVKRIAEELLPHLGALGAQVHFLICGMNPPQYYAHPQITFTGMVQDLPEHLAAADLAVVPLEDGGGTRLKILEYFAAGLPVVSTQKGAEGIPVNDGDALLIRDDYQAMAQAVVHLFTHGEIRERIAKNGLQFAHLYAWEAVAKQWLSLYNGQSVPDIRDAQLSAEEWAQVEALTPQNAPPSPTPAIKKGPSPWPQDPLMAVADQIPVQITPTKQNTMIMMINRGCNLRCDFCDLYNNPKLFPLEKALSIIDQAAEMGVKTIVFTGGEPTLHPGLWKMLDRAKSHGIGTNITTNGTTIKKHLEAFTSGCLDSISVSLDGLKDTHENLRKIPGCFDKTLEGLKLLKKAGGPHVNIYFVITGSNIHELIPVYDLAKKMGFGFDFWPVNDAQDLYLISKKERQAYRKAITTLAKRDPAVAAKKDYYLAGLDYHGGWDKRVRCLGLIEQFGVNLEGDLVPCCVWDNQDLKIGKIGDKPGEGLADLWYGAEARKRRQEINGIGCHNLCFNHSLYEYQLATGQSFMVGDGAKAWPAADEKKSLGPSSPEVAASADLAPVEPAPADPPLQAMPPAELRPPHFPGSYLVLELANGCNLKCTHCAQADTNHPHYAKTGYFPRASVRALMDDLKAMGARFDALILFWLGEPLLHPEFTEIYRDILENSVEIDGVFHPFGKIEVHTNGILLSQKMTHAIVNNHAIPQRWHFTIDAQKEETYRLLKGADQLRRVQENIAYYYTHKAKTRTKWPHTALQYIVSDKNAPESADFITHWQNIIEDAGLKSGLTARHVPDDFERQFIFLKSLDCPTPKEQTRQNKIYRKVLAQYDLVQKKEHQDVIATGKSVVAKNLSPCSGFWKSPVIGWNGQLTTCTRDSLGHNRIGNILETPFSELWYRSPQLEGWRQAVATGNYKDLKLCQTCFIPQSVNYTDITATEITAHRAWSQQRKGEARS